MAARELALRLLGTCGDEAINFVLAKHVTGPLTFRVNSPCVKRGQLSALDHGVDRPNRKPQYTCGLGWGIHPRFWMRHGVIGHVTEFLSRYYLLFQVALPAEANQVIKSIGVGCGLVEAERTDVVNIKPFSELMFGRTAVLARMAITPSGELALKHPVGAVA